MIPGRVKPKLQTGIGIYLFKPTGDLFESKKTGKHGNIICTALSQNVHFEYGWKVDNFPREF
jgi:hypothetical protein